MVEKESGVSQTHDEWSTYIEGWKRRVAREEADRARWLERARQDARRLAGILGTEFGVRRVLLCGSLCSGQAHAGSDIDLAVEGLAPEVYFRAWARLEQETEIPVDLIDLTTAKPSLVNRICRDGVILFERER